MCLGMELWGSRQHGRHGGIIQGGIIGGALRGVPPTMGGGPLDVGDCLRLEWPGEALAGQERVLHRLIRIPPCLRIQVLIHNHGGTYLKDTLNVCLKEKGKHQCY